jgi:hypothetical protein
MTRPHFGTRDLLWAMLVLGLALGWLRTYRHLAVAQHNVRALQGAFEPEELRYANSGKIIEMPLNARP